MGEWYSEKILSKIKPERLERLRLVAELWNKRSLGVRETARELGVSAATICHDRKLLLELWRSTVAADVDELVGRELGKLEAQEEELWLAWERSKEDKRRETETEKRAGEGNGVDRTSSTVTEGRLPDPRYQELIEKLGEERRKLLGLDKGIKLDLGFDFRELVAAAAERERARAGRAEKARERDELDRA